MLAQRLAALDVEGGKGSSTALVAHDTKSPTERAAQVFKMFEGASSAVVPYSNVPQSMLMRGGPLAAEIRLLLIMLGVESVGDDTLRRAGAWVKATTRAEALKAPPSWPR